MLLANVWKLGRIRTFPYTPRVKPMNTGVRKVLYIRREEQRTLERGVSRIPVRQGQISMIDAGVSCTTPYRWVRHSLVTVS